MANSSPDDEHLTWEFMERTLDGEINLGSNHVEGGGMVGIGPGGGVPGAGTKVMMGSGGHTDLYAEKGSMYGVVYKPYVTLRPQTLDQKTDTKKNAIKRIKSLTEDLPGFDLASDSLTKDWESDNVVSLIRRYNLAKHKPTQNNSSRFGVVTFYLKPTAKATSVKLVVDDAKEYELTVAKPTTVLIPDDEVVKVCLVSAATSDCQLLRGTRCCNRYFQVTQNDGKGKLEVEPSKESEALRYILQGRKK